MYTIGQLEGEIEAKIEMLEERFPDQDLEPTWVAEAVMQDHALPAGIDSDGFHHCVEYRTVREYTRRVMNRYDLTASKAPDLQLVLPGYERLQTHYLVERNGTQCMVRVDRTTHAERRAKAEELRAMGAGCYQHADELDRYDGETRRLTA